MTILILLGSTLSFGFKRDPQNCMCEFYMILATSSVSNKRKSLQSCSIDKKWNYIKFILRKIVLSLFYNNSTTLEDSMTIEWDNKRSLPV